MRFVPWVVLLSCATPLACGPTIVVDGAGGDGRRPTRSSDGGADLRPAADPRDCRDADHDGWTTCAGDCDDANPAVHPGAIEVCNGIDDNCNGLTDEGFDKDHDGWTTCAGDCNDADPRVHPGATPICNGQDNDCDGTIDDIQDHDQDTFAVCTDCDDHDPLVNPGAFEVQGNHVDDNCNGTTDEPEPPCDVGLGAGSSLGMDFARSLDLCSFVLSAGFSRLADARAHQLATDWGVFQPRSGHSLVALSTGVAADENDTAPAFITGQTPQPGTDFMQTNTPNPLPPAQHTCVDKAGVLRTFTDPATVNDYTELVLVLRAPTNALSFSFDFNFLSAEYPEWVCTEFNDQFLVVMQSKKTNGNISFDAKGDPVTINNAFFTVIKAADLVGTGMERIDPAGSPYGGATGWLTTTAPVTPGEQFTLRFIVFDEGDDIYDSQVLLDNFRWSLEGSCGPTTARPGAVPDGGTAGGAGCGQVGGAPTDGGVRD
jgi:hypothetical protein